MRSTVVVIGGGYGGALAAKLLDAEADVTLIDPREGFVNAAAQLRALTRPDWAPNAFFPYSALLDRGRVLRDRAVSVDPRGVTLASGGRVEADHLVLATGSGYPYPAKPRHTSTSIAQQLDDLRVTHRELAAAARVQIIGAGPVGLELAGEIKEVWPDKSVVVVDRGGPLLPGFLPEVRAALHRQLDALGIALRPEPGAADLTFRAHGVRVDTGYLADGRLARPTAHGTVQVTELLQLPGHEHVYAIGDVAALPDPKMASYAMVHAEIAARNILGDRTVYTPSPERRILLPLGTRGGVGQLPVPGGGVAAATPAVVVERKGADLFTARFAAWFTASSAGAAARSAGA
ncbi:FAD-dependent oxidoreductase [Dactylosporangium matsuzakiense]|uniref:Pyridine nucleotide-disulfide oxidoreductase n=1 Tax=Dactylosporangium matsuzakiense TaxID=53360 RepID=A0A9W6KWX5_9ACTN|nr:FAD-dependent oxidoreductase [Dactylosporangium matsuzakiense]UWZ48191.1 FAD-dependent oxidoreductase [Dactylosporangium matsuzakiense]GLL08076.1 pyridine nucleotide-disulfide oxidoreductase [Dactylosporangium matsuzakiense]